MIIFGIVIYLGGLASYRFQLLIGDIPGSLHLHAVSDHKILIGSQQALLEILNKLLHVLVSSVG